jgi:hypothetical protein
MALTITTLAAFVQTSFAASSTGGIKIALNNAYLKPDGTYAVVVRDVPNIQLALYVNDKNPAYTTVNKKGWATFRGVKLTSNSKISFGRVFKSASKTYQKPINYARYVSLTDAAVTFLVTNPVKPTATTVQTKPTSTEKVSTPAPVPTPHPTCTNGTYVNSAGNTICSPEAAPSAPAGATAQCVDGTYSFSQSHSGTCSHHGGVASWL